MLVSITTGVHRLLSAPMPSVHNVLTATVDYLPVTLGEKTFWMPGRVTSTFSDKVKPINLRYQAAYSNYRRFSATVSIGPANPTTSPE
jgi:hypothetical protein